ncbi:hypothetical protein [Kibdelosporangium philippinense]|uniref:hypothetical protein n=1 Tax=Kibdelosporangium philippinense TaxID=211113 RepID=UPI0036244C27
MPGIGDLAGELNDVVQRVPSRAFQKLEGHGPLELPHLWAVAERVLPGAWETDPSDALEQLLRLAIDRLEGDFNGAISNQHAAYLLFNLDGAPSLPEVKPLDLDGVDGKHSSKIIQRLKKAAVLPPRAEHTSRTSRSCGDRWRRSCLTPILDMRTPQLDKRHLLIHLLQPVSAFGST